MIWNKKIKIGNQEIEYTLKKRRGVGSVKLSVHPDGFVSVSAPNWYPIYLIQKFVGEKADWILEKIKNKDLLPRQSDQKKEYQNLKESARKIITERVEFFSQLYGFSFGKIAIRNQRTCWGSCSRKKNLNFNYKIIKLSEELRDFIIVHEICHLKEMNHSSNFWMLVEKSFPNQKTLRKELRKIKV